jgi:hypothetical protein
VAEVAVLVETTVAVLAEAVEQALSFKDGQHQLLAL